jgi:hypothetical protein
MQGVAVVSLARAETPPLDYATLVPVGMTLLGYARFASFLSE